MARFALNQPSSSQEDEVAKKILDISMALLSKDEGQFSLKRITTYTEESL